MTKPISEYTDPKDLRNLMANAKRLNRDDIWREAFLRLCALDGLDQADPLHRDFYTTLAAYEELLSEKNGRTTVAAYTRRKLKNKGVVQCLEDWATASGSTDGFKLLIALGMAELTGEYLVMKYPDRFSQGAVSAASARMEQATARP
jgi:hypothetical protein